MSFELDLYAIVRDWEEAERAAAATADDGHVSIAVGRRTRWRRALKPSIQFDWREGQDVLSDEADWDHDAFKFSDEGCHALAATVLALADVLEPGRRIRSYWGGDPLNGERVVTAQELAELVRQSRLDRCTLYRVK